MAKKGQRGGRSSGQKVTVALLINDEDVLREVNEIISKHYPEGATDNSSVKVTGQWTDFNEGFSLLAERRPTIAILGVSKKDDKGVSALAERVSVELPDTCIFIVGANKDPDTMIKAMRAGCKEFITKPLEANILDSINRVQIQLEQKVGVGPRVIGVASFKGGSGATVLAVNLATALRLLTKKRTLLLDACAGGGDIALYLNLKYKYTLKDVMSNLDRLDSTLLSSYAIEHPSGVQVIPAVGFLEHLKETQSELFKSREALQFLFDFLKTEFAYTVVDVGYAFYTDAIEVLKLLDDILLVMTLDLASVSNAKEGLMVLEEGGCLEKTSLIVNRYDKRYAKIPTAISLEDVVKTLNMPLLCNIPNDYMCISECVNLGLVTVTERPKSLVAQRYQELAGLISKAAVPSVSTK